MESGEVMRSRVKVGIGMCLLWSWLAAAHAQAQTAWPAERAQPSAAVLGAASSAIETEQSASTSSGQLLARSSTLTAYDGRLFLRGVPLAKMGINVPQAGTHYDVNAGCGAPVDLTVLFDRLPKNTLVRVFFGQDLTINAETGQRDWRGLDRVVSAAEASPSQPILIAALTNQWGICDGGGYKDQSWYAGGFRQPFVEYPDGLPRVSYWSYLAEVTNRYGASPAIGIWEPAGEAEASICRRTATDRTCGSASLTCPPDAPKTLQAFFEKVAPVIRRRARGALIASGAIGGGQCGWNAALEASAALDILTVHDYSTGEGLHPAGAATMVRASRRGKPVLLEEVGLNARDQVGCNSTQHRADVLQHKAAAAGALGADAVLLWAYGEGSTACDYYIGPNDPDFALLYRG